MIGAAARPAGAPGPVAPPAPLPQALVLDWQVGTATGWQVFGLNLALELLRDGRVTPLLLEPTDLAQFDPLQRHALALPLAQQPGLRAMLAAAGEAGLSCEYPVLRALGNGFQGNDGSRRLLSDRNVGVIFFEDTALDAPAMERAWSFDRIVAGSTWNGRVLEARGLDTVRVVPQGIDPAVFHPAPRAGRLAGRFVVFSGGKLEYRKGQDLVVAAFRAFQRRHPEALLLTAWHNAWPRTMVGLETAGHVQGLPAVDAYGRLALEPWLLANGLPAGSFLDLGVLPNHRMAAALREADVALFPNRCEGGTNLVAMEAMACGVPVILSANTGHLDLLTDPEASWRLDHQGRPRGGCPLYRGMDDWGESEVEEMVERLEASYRDRADAAHRGIAAARLMQERWSWRRRAAELLEALPA